ncbi:Histone transcription regulator 3, partial [Ascosphaera atra]
MIEIVTNDLYDQGCVLHNSDESTKFLMKSLNTLYALLTDFTERIRDEPENMFENLDNARLQVSISVFLKIGRFLQAFAYTEDAIRVGYWSAPDVRAAARARALEQFREKLRSMIVISWTLLYLLFREGIIQNKEAFSEPDCDRISYLRSMHNALGLRYYCKYADKFFLRLMKRELQSLPPQPDYEFEVAQVFFDLYGLKFGAGLDVIVDHRCPLETMDPPTAISIVDFIMMHARRINIKDLHRSELKAAIDT